jgi:tRNA(Ile)-lysidine synthase
VSELHPDLPPDAARAGVLVAWSGGLDSTVLLHLIREWALDNDADFAAVHVDHGLRLSSREDAAFCRRTAAKLGIPLLVEALHVRPDGSTQQNARLQRYAAIARAAVRMGLGVVLTAHHADDALETALLNFRRGTSSGGLSALQRADDPANAQQSLSRPPVPAWPAELAICRPLIASTRAGIRDYAERCGIEWHEDPTNAQSRYQRNRLRHEVVPALSEDGRYLPSMLATLENLASERAALECLADRAIENALLTAPDAESVALRVAPLRAMPAAVVTLALQRAARRLPAEVALSREHLNQVADAILTRATLRLDVRGGVIHVAEHLLLIEVARGRGGRHLHERRAQPISIDPRRIPGRLPWFGTHLAWDLTPADADAPRDAFAFEAAPLRNQSQPYEPMILRGPRPGDRIDVRGMRGHKSVTDILNEAGVPAFFRWRWPCIARNAQTNEVEWVCGLRHAENPAQIAAPQTPDAPKLEPVDQARILRIQWDVPPLSVFAAIGLKRPSE